MRDNVLIVSSSENFIDMAIMTTNKLGYQDITVCRNKDDAVTKINEIRFNTDNSGIMILDQDLKEHETSVTVTERNGENVAIKLMQEDLEIPTYFIGSQISKYHDDNIICKIDSTQENVSETLEKGILQAQEKEE